MTLEHKIFSTALSKVCTSRRRNAKDERDKKSTPSSAG